MATNYFKAIHHHLRRRHSIDCPPSSSSSSSAFFPKPTTKTSSTTTTTFSSLSSTTSSSSSSITTTTPNSTNISFDLLQQHLSTQNFRQADEETRRLLIVLAGESAVKRGYVFFSEVQFISKDDLKAIDELWRRYSDEKFGYSVQKKIWKKVGKDFTRFFVKVGWMKKLDTEVVQYNYRAFPNEFIWEINDESETPLGHLPLTNALRGTQLLNCVLSHPAFEAEDDEEETSEESTENNGVMRSTSTSGSDNKPLDKSKLFKPDYSF